MCALRAADDHQLLSTFLQILLQSGDLLMLSNEARYNWRHGIDSVKEELYQGLQPVVRGRRVSITLRKLCSGIVLGST